jgi:Helix-turn-helix domain
MRICRRTKETRIGVCGPRDGRWGAIARALGRAKTTISRELQQNALPYSPLHAAGAYQLRRRREAILEREAASRSPRGSGKAPQKPSQGCSRCSAVSILICEDQSPRQRQGLRPARPAQDHARYDDLVLRRLCLMAKRRHRKCQWTLTSMTATPPGYRSDIRPGYPGDRPYDQPAPLLRAKKIYEMPIGPIAENGQTSIGRTLCLYSNSKTYFCGNACISILSCLPSPAR